MADPRLKSPDRWVEYRGECDWVSFFFFFYLLELLLLLFPAVADEINESVEKIRLAGDYMMESFQLTIEGAVAAKYGECMRKTLRHDSYSKVSTS